MLARIRLELAPVDSGERGLFQKLLSVIDQQLRLLQRAEMR
jgi:hypothetical protein